MPVTPKDNKFIASHPKKPHPTELSSLFSLEKQKTLIIYISSYFLETLASPHENTWHHIGGPIKKTIDYFHLNPNHRRSVEHAWKN